MQDIFISYRRKGGKDIAGRIADSLRRIELSDGRTLGVFLDKLSMQAAKEFPQQINHAITESPNFILILSPFALSSCKREKDKDWVFTEICKAIEQEKKIIPILVDGFKFPKKLPNEISRIRDIHYIKYDDEGYDRFISDLKDLLITAEGGKYEYSSGTTIQVTITSPVYMDVYFNEDTTPLGCINPNTGIYTCDFSLKDTKNFTLHFQSRGFFKSVIFEIKGQKQIIYDIGTILTRREIIMSYSRDNALHTLAETPTEYAFTQIEKTGESCDIFVLLNLFDKLNNELRGACLCAICGICLKNKKNIDIALNTLEQYSTSAMGKYAMHLADLKEKLGKALLSSETSWPVNINDKTYGNVSASFKNGNVVVTGSKIAIINLMCVIINSLCAQYKQTMEEFIDYSQDYLFNDQNLDDTNAEISFCVKNGIINESIICGDCVHIYFAFQSIICCAAKECHESVPTIINEISCSFKAMVHKSKGNSQTTQLTQISEIS